MRYIVVGAGAVGGTLAARLITSGARVAVVARGPHATVMQESGLELHTPHGTERVHFPIHTDPRAAGIERGDVVLLTTKSQDTLEVMRALSWMGDPGCTVVCVQNGVDNERVALRHVAEVCGAWVFLPATHTVPGVVIAHSDPTVGVLTIGKYPHGADHTVHAICRDLEAAGIRAHPDGQVMSWKYGKLIDSVANAVDAVVGASRGADALTDRARAEAIDCLNAAGITFVSRAESDVRKAELSPMRAVDGTFRQGESSWQSLSRGSSSIETDWLNGEVVLLGRLHGVPTPVNRALQIAANRLCAERTGPGSLSVDDLTELVDACGGAT